MGCTGIRRSATGAATRVGAVARHLCRSWGTTASTTPAPLAGLVVAVPGRDPARLEISSGLFIEFVTDGITSARPRLLEVVLAGGEAAASGWRAAGFDLSAAGSACHFENVRLSLRPAATAAALPTRRSGQHPNHVQLLDELVLYTADLSVLVGELKAVGIGTYRGRPPRQLGSNGNAVATFIFEGAFGSTIRVLVFGGEPPSSNPDWMFGDPGGPAVQVTGLLLVADDLAAAHAAISTASERKPADQKGREIFSVRRGTIPGLPVTLAILGPIL